MTGTGQLSFVFDVRPAMNQEDFLVAPCNEDAVSWIDAWPEWPGRALCVYGPPGCGKSHLAHVWRSRSGATEITADRLDSAAVGELSTDVKCCVVEDAYPVADETALFHLFNTLVERRGYLLITAERPPSRWDIGLKDLRSRLLAVPSQEIGLPDEGLLGAVMIKMFADRQIDVSHDVLVYLVMRIERSFDGARQVVDALDRAALAAHRRLTVPLARDVLKDLGMA